MPHGYRGRILRVDLSQRTLRTEEPTEAVYRTYLGGSALNMQFLLRERRPGLDPFAADSLLCLSLSVVTGAPISGLSRMTATARSPLTGGVGDSQCGGSWPVNLKRAGFDAIQLSGRAESPVYLWISNGEAELRDASHLWGRVTGEVEAAIRDELGDPGIDVLQIGPAGEKLVRFASLINNCNRANGRTGMGAVMGSKNLKAVAVRGSQRLEIADAGALAATIHEAATRFAKSGLGGLGKFGTNGVLAAQHTVGGLPSFNYRSGVFDDWNRIDGEAMYDTILRGHDEGKQEQRGRDTCFACIIRCKRIVEIEGGRHTVDPTYGGPEYETVAAFGSYCGVSDLSTIAKANEICNKYGMDTISCGATIAWAMEAFEAGDLRPSDTAGMDLRFGNGEAVVRLAEMIAKREGLGDTLAEGSALAASRLGVGKARLTTCKGVEMPAHMPQVKRSLALVYAANPFGADHNSSEHDPAYETDYDYYAGRLALLGLHDPQPSRSLGPGKVEFARKTQHLYGLLDSLNLCAFVFGPSWQLYGPAEMVDVVRAVTGWDVTLDELLAVGERRLNMMRLYNAREGIGRQQDTLPDRFFDSALQGGPSNGWKIPREEFDAAVAEYYHQSGWDPETGCPTPQTLQRLGLGWAIG